MELNPTEQVSQANPEDPVVNHDEVIPTKGSDAIVMDRSHLSASDSHPHLLFLDKDPLSVASIATGYRRQQAESDASLMICIADPAQVSASLQASVDLLQQALKSGQVIYGVNTLYGGLANQLTDADSQLQHYLIESHMVGGGADVKDRDVWLTLVLRANSLVQGASAVRLEIVERLLELANRQLLPRIGQLGSIGASGDLVPLAAMAGAAMGLDGDFELKQDGAFYPAKQVLAEQGLDAITLQPKEGLALINGTSCHTAIAVNNYIRAQQLMTLQMQIAMLNMETLQADTQAFAEFIHQVRPHPGQQKIAALLREHLSDSQLAKLKGCAKQRVTDNHSVQDKYSVRCYPQFIGPCLEDMKFIEQRLDREINSVSDNPLFDVEQQAFWFGGNFLGQQVALDMDKLRVILCLLAKHMDAQIAELVDPLSNRGLSASLADIESDEKTIGIKPLQIFSNSIVPRLEHNAAPLSVHFPVHAEQNNQNVNSQAFGSSCMTQQSLDLLEQQLSIALVIGAEAAKLRAVQQQKSIEDLYSGASNHLLNSAFAQSKHLSKDKPLTRSNSQYIKAWLNAINERLSQDPMSLIDITLFDKMWID